MEGFLPYDACGNPDCPPGSQGSGWAKPGSRFITPQGLNYLDLCKAIIAQVGPGAPPLRKRANTKECGVQVNGKVDKIIQCSLGPKTLLCWGEGGEHRERAQAPKPDESAPCKLRFVYAPVFERKAPSPKELRDRGGSEEDAEQADSDGDAETDPSCGETAKDSETTFLRSSSQGSNFQFLEQRYGFFHCKQCNIRWESAYVWCISGTSKVYYKQLCRKCQVGFNPYRVESILCRGCSQTCCSCEKKQRHINMKRPHRQDLCCRCKGMVLSCDTTYSYKYIV
ncbi:protein ZAR1-like [Brachionichthys hirsutus]|uniref:protein ZAR1-like n=1 Tax=Brachionichthys hirsutus TaxID=412623 RepID=UPI003604E4A9